MGTKSMNLIQMSSVNQTLTWHSIESWLINFGIPTMASSNPNSHITGCSSCCDFESPWTKLYGVISPEDDFVKLEDFFGCPPRVARRPMAPTDECSYPFNQGGAAHDDAEKPTLWAPVQRCRRSVPKLGGLMSQLWFQTMNPLPETNSEFAPENGWLKYDRFLLG